MTNPPPPDFESVSAFPLSWPFGWKRTIASSRARAAFSNHSMSRANDEVLGELRRMGVQGWNVVISTNLAVRKDGLPRAGLAQPADPGVAVYFRLDGKPHVLACDRWDRVEHNLWAIAKHVNALRAQDRYGVGSLEQAFAGYVALPGQQASGAPWWVILGFSSEPTLALARSAYERLAQQHHPDKGGDAARFASISDAWRQAKAALRDSGS